MVVSVTCTSSGLLPNKNSCVSRGGAVKQSPNKMESCHVKDGALGVFSTAKPIYEKTREETKGGLLFSAVTSCG